MSIAPDLLDNPLINPPKLPRNAMPLNKVKSRHFMPAIQYGIECLRAEIGIIKNNPDRPTFENTIEAIEFSGSDLARANAVLELFDNSKNTRVISKLKKQTGPMVSSVYSGIFQDADLFARVKAVHDDPESERLDPQQKMLLKNTYKAFLKTGAGLTAEQKQRFAEIKQRLSVLSTTFGENVLRMTAKYKLFIDDEARLDGLPERVKKEYKANAVKAKKPDQWLVLLEPYPMEIMTHANDRSLREEIARAYSMVGMSKGKRDNRPVQLEMIRLKHELASLMGHATIADHVLEDSMAGSAKTVNDFLQRNLEVYKPAAEAYLQKVREFAGEEDGLTDLKAWDVGYYGRKLKEKMFSINMESLRPYFELKSTFNALVKHAEMVADVDLREVPKRRYPVHHKDVTVYEAFRKSSNSFIGLFYANYYARPGAKNGGAWMDELQSYSTAGPVPATPAITNDCNYKKNEDGAPTLISFRDAETMNHEFGHGLHGLLTTARYESLAGTRVKRDWVELPSQLQEGWVMANARDPKSDFGRHYQTGEKIPADLLDRIQAMQNFDAGYVGLRQTFFGLLDMKWHSTNPELITSVEELEDSVGAVATLLPRAHGCMSTSFTHLFSGGYAAGYYGYKWADVMAADVFAKSQERGLIYDKAFLDRVVSCVYETGGTREHSATYRDLMGRDPDQNALFRREGLIPA